MKLLVVESPAKAKTINKYLGSDYEVIASFGHIRDLPAKDGSVDPENDFAMLWETEGRGAKQVAEIAMPSITPMMSEILFELAVIDAIFSTTYQFTITPQGAAQ